MQVNWTEEAGVTKRSAHPALEKAGCCWGCSGGKAAGQLSSVVVELLVWLGGQLPEAARVPEVQARCPPA